MAENLKTYEYGPKLAYAEGQEPDRKRDASVFAYMPAFSYLIVCEGAQPSGCIAQQKFTGREEDVNSWQWEPDLERANLHPQEVKAALEIFTESQNFAYNKDGKHKRLLKSGLIDNLAPALGQITELIRAEEPDTAGYDELLIDDTPASANGDSVLYLRIGQRVVYPPDRSGVPIPMIQRSNLYMFNLSRGILSQYDGDTQNYSPDDPNNWKTAAIITPLTAYIGTEQLAEINR